MVTVWTRSGCPRRPVWCHERWRCCPCPSTDTSPPKHRHQFIWLIIGNRFKCTDRFTGSPADDPWPEPLWSRTWRPRCWTVSGGNIGRGSSPETHVRGVTFIKTSRVTSKREERSHDSPDTVAGTRCRDERGRSLWKDWTQTLVLFTLFHVKIYRFDLINYQQREERKHQPNESNSKSSKSIELLWKDKNIIVLTSSQNWMFVTRLHKVHRGK